jgi:hypothetical protein
VVEARLAQASYRTHGEESRAHASLLHAAKAISSDHVAAVQGEADRLERWREQIAENYPGARRRLTDTEMWEAASDLIHGEGTKAATRARLRWRLLSSDAHALPWSTNFRRRKSGRAELWLDNRPDTHRVQHQLPLDDYMDALRDIDKLGRLTMRSAIKRGLRVRSKPKLERV